MGVEGAHPRHLVERPALVVAKGMLHCHAFGVGPARRRVVWDAPRVHSGRDVRAAGRVAVPDGDAAPPGFAQVPCTSVAATALGKLPAGSLADVDAAWFAKARPTPHVARHAELVGTAVGVGGTHAALGEFGRNRARLRLRGVVAFERGQAAFEALRTWLTEAVNLVGFLVGPGVLFRSPRVALRVSFRVHAFGSVSHERRIRRTRVLGAWSNFVSHGATERRAHEKSDEA